MTGNQLEDDEFYGLNIVEKFDDEAMAKHVYRDPVQLEVRIVLCRSLITVFMTFHYVEDPNTKLTLTLSMMNLCVTLLISRIVWMKWKEKVI